MCFASLIIIIIIICILIDNRCRSSLGEDGQPSNKRPRLVFTDIQKRTLQVGIFLLFEIVELQIVKTCDMPFH